MGGGGTAYASAEPSWRLHGCLCRQVADRAAAQSTAPPLVKAQGETGPCRAVGEAAQNNKPGLCEVVPADYCGCRSSPPASQSIIQHVAELPDYLGIAEIAGGRITGAAECDRADRR